MAQAALTYSNWTTQARANILAVIDNVANVPDPYGTTSSQRKFVYTRRPDVQAKKFGGYPFIVLPLTSINFTDQRSLDSRHAFFTGSAKIEVVGSDRRGLEGDQHGADQVNAVVDSLLAALNSQTQSLALMAFGMRKIRATANSEPAWSALSGTLTCSRIVMVTFEGRRPVTA